MWFGDPWPSADYRAPVCEDDADRVPAPIGETCLHCREGITGEDRGILMPYLDVDGRHVGPVHAECLLRMTLGGPAHLMGLCRCHGGPGDVDDPDLGMSAREAARLVWRATGAHQPD